MLESLLIANRGEIACRVIRTARRRGLRTVAVYSDADADALHVAAADTAVRIGGPAARDSYLSIDAILGAARESGAEAIHPGYGFLSENAAFAEACATAGLVFVGPPAAAIRAMGSKSEAKRLMEAAGVPLVPGYHGDSQDPARLAEEAQRIGYPVLVKASAGGGGKGMRVVARPVDLEEAIAGASREAQAAFGDGRLLVERYLEAPRHVEIQVFADGHGGTVHLFERDCSVQRRHQKVIEEAPAPDLPPAVREAMGAAAVRAARAIGYVGAGTVEFLLDRDGRFYFMEMNTRLQVEHPVTEMITGLDLVAWQLAVAEGERLPLEQAGLAFRGHAIEARLYAEDPARGFVPAPGRIAVLALPEDGGDVRVDAGVRSGDTISVHYDPMIAKIVAWGPDRASALARLGRALAGARVLGPATNLGFIERILRHPAFVAGGVATDFIARHEDRLLAPPAPPDATALGLAALAVLRRGADEAAAAAARSRDPHSPWHATTGWRLNDDNHHVVTLRHGETEHAVTVHFRRDATVLDLPDGARRGAARLDPDGRLEATLGDVRHVAAVSFDGRRLELVDGRGGRWRLEHVDPLERAAAAERPDGRLSAPMPGKVVRIAVAAGDRVVAGQPLMVLEAMKMEHTIRAAADGRVAAVRFAVGELVEEGADLVVVEAEA